MKTILTIIFAVLTLQVSSSVVVFVVTKTIDPNPLVYKFNYDDSQCDTVMMGTLQWAIRKANQTYEDTIIIQFNISGAGIHEILLNYELPMITTENRHLIIDGTSQSGYVYGTPVIKINGQNNIGTCFQSYKSKITIKGFAINNFLYHGIVVNTPFGTSEVKENNISNIDNGINFTAAIAIRMILSSAANQVNIQGNNIGTESTNTNIEDYGMFIESSDNSLIGGTGQNQPNTITNCGRRGIYIASSNSIQISANRIYNNPVAIYLSYGSNNNKAAPVITSFTGTAVIGTSEPNNIIEVFGSSGNENANEYLTTVTADVSGNWTATVNTSYLGVAATATDNFNNTSVLSNTFETTTIPISLSFSTTNATCNGINNGSIDLTVTGGTPQYSFLWSNGATTEDIDSLFAGTYFVTVTDIVANTAMGIAEIDEADADTITNPDAARACKDLFISEYVEGTVHNTALEFYNSSEDIIILNRYFVRVFINGAPTPLITQLAGTLAPGQTHVIANPNAGAAILAKANQTSNKINFDGDDAIQFIKVLNDININLDSIEGHGGNPHDIFVMLQLDTLDLIGEIGVNPGNNGWTVGNASTKNTTLIRNYGVNRGKTDWDCGQEQWQTLPQDDVSNLGTHQNVCGQLLTNDISFSFANPTETGTNPRYFEFDIMVSSNNNLTYLDYCESYIQFNTAAFNTYLVTNNKITYTLGTNFNNNTYNGQFTSLMEYDANAFSLSVGADFNATPFNRTPITVTAQQLVHIKMEVADCNQMTDILFFDTLTSAGVSYYSDLPSLSGDSYNYDNTTYGTGLNQELCPHTVITNMYPNPITSGTNTVLTIEGYHFGSTRDTGQVWMYNDKGGSAQIKHFDYIDYLSWTDTEIKFIVPSRVDTLGQDTLGIGAGSGHVTVYRSDGATGISSVPLQISYANMNVSIGYTSPYSNYQKIPIRVIADYQDTCKYFYLDTSIVNNPMMEVAVREALHHWSCATLINWYVKGETTLQHIADDVSVIYLENSFHGNPLARTWHTNGITCTDINGKKVAYYNDIDIGLSRDFNNISATSWFIDTSYTQDLDTNKHDFYAVSQHELGHAHSLEHVNDNTDLMYYSASYGPINYVYRRDLYSSPNTIYGGVYVLDKSGLLTSTSCSGISIMVPATAENCESNIWVSELFNKDIYIKAYPNPIDEILNVSYSLKRNNDIRFSIYDFMGKIIINYYVPKQSIGTHNIEFNFNDISTGIYFLMVDFGFKKETIKLIKI